MRLGVLSDAYIKTTNPQFFPLELGSDMGGITLPTHKLQGIKQSFRCVSRARRPIMDLHNFSEIAAPQDSVVTERKSVIQYKHLISNAMGPTDVQQDVTMSDMSDSPMLTLKGPGGLMTSTTPSGMFSRRITHTLTKLVEPGQLEALEDVLYPQGFNPKFKQTDHEIMSKLIKLYPDEIEMIQSSYDQSLNVNPVESQSGADEDAM